ncbi:hypothetical protein ACOME3_008179 [Neoechinorhynchus agilis]
MTKNTSLKSSDTQESHFSGNIYKDMSLTNDPSSNYQTVPPRPLDGQMYSPYACNASLSSQHQTNIGHQYPFAQPQQADIIRQMNTSSLQTPIYQQSMMNGMARASYGFAATNQPSTQQILPTQNSTQSQHQHQFYAHGVARPDLMFGNNLALYNYSVSIDNSHLQRMRSCCTCGSHLINISWRYDSSGNVFCEPCAQMHMYPRVSSNAGPFAEKSSHRRMHGTRSNIQCANCGTNETTLWRRNSQGESVCNACGLYYKLHKVNRPLSMKKQGLQTRKRKKTDKSKMDLPSAKKIRKDDQIQLDPHSTYVSRQLSSAKQRWH